MIRLQECAGCVFFKPEAARVTYGDRGALGICVRYPPGPPHPPFDGWPQVYETDWCGEYHAPDPPPDPEPRSSPEPQGRPLDPALLIFRCEQLADWCASASRSGQFGKHASAVQAGRAMAYAWLAAYLRGDVEWSAAWEQAPRP